MLNELITIQWTKSYMFKNDVSSANSVAVDCKLLGRLFMYIRKANSNCPKIEPFGTPAGTDG